MKFLSVLTVISSLVMFVPQANADLVLHLGLDDGTGSTATDSSANGLDGTLNNMDDNDWVAGQAGSALDFDGGNDFVLVTDSSLLDFGSGDFSVSYWAFKKSATIGFDNLYGVSKWGSGANPGTNEWLLNVGSSSNTDRPTFVVEVGSSFFRARSPDDISLNEWHHIVGTRKDSTLRIYVDSVLKDEDSSMPSGSTINNTGRDLAIATNTLPANAIFRTAAIFDDVQIYDFALSDGGTAVGETAGGNVAFLFNNAGSAVPEPSSLAMLSLTALGFCAYRRLRSGRKQL